MPEMPRPDANHARLARLAGRWKGEEKTAPSPWAPEGSVTKGRSDARMDLGGFFLVSEYTQEKDGDVTFTGHGVYGWNGQSYTMHWFDTMGIDPGAPVLGNWDGDTLRFERVADGKGHRYDYAFDGADKYTFTMSLSMDGGATWTTMMEGTFTRK